ncbi:MAG: tetratricopeptide repeat protein [Candidatus Aminicenantes bacterium]|nr:tetratricopeptide repeat protein [Candidatus Aminicenantes bacterium]
MIKHAARAAMVAVLIASFAAGTALAQAGRGVGRIGGVVLDLEDKPIEGVKIQIVFSQNENLKFESATNKKGEWSFLGLGTGNWHMTAFLSGYDPMTQTLYVSQLQVNPKVTIRLKKAERPGGGIIQDEASFAFLEKGNQLYREGNFDEAIVQYRQFIEKNPQAYQVELNIADCHREKGEFDKAMEIYNKIIGLAEADKVLGREMAAKAQAGIGNIYVKQNKLAEAQEYFKQSIESSPKDEVLAYNVGEIFFSNQQLDEALKYFDLARQIKPDWPDPYLKLGYVYLNKADNGSAIAQFEKFLTLEPEGERAALAKNILNAIRK